MKRFWLALPLVIIVLLASCSTTRTLLRTAPITPQGTVASPILPMVSRERWQEKVVPQIRTALQETIYGRFPKTLTLERIDSTALEGAFFDNSATITLQTLAITNPATGAVREFGLVIARPVGALPGVPVIMMENFCPNTAVFPIPQIPKPDGDFMSCDGKGLMSHVFGYFFGRYITTPPTAMIMDHGYALASVFPSEFIPDTADGGVTIINTIFADQDVATRTHALMAWAAQYSLLSDYLKSREGFSKTIAYGHSRFAKAALVAAAFDPTIDAVVAHQSGTGGASLSRDKTGEGLESISENYPHWFLPKFATYAKNKAALPVDQHQLLALIAPRPMFLGNARRDVWSDPNGAFRAAQAASVAYGLYGSQGLRQKTLKDFDASADIAFWLRPGTHGVVKEDWPAFLEFLDAHFK